MKSTRSNGQGRAKSARAPHIQSPKPEKNAERQGVWGRVLVCDTVSTVGPPATQSAGVERKGRHSQLLLSTRATQSARATLQRRSQLEAKGGATQSAPPSPLIGSGNTAMSSIGWY